MLRRDFMKSCLASAALATLPIDLRIESTAQASPAQTAAGGSPTRISALPLANVQIDDSFWSPKRTLWRAVTINDCLDKFETTGAIANFDLAANRATSGHHGDPWWDGLIYEMITASSDFLAVDYDPALDKRIDSIIARIAAAAEADPNGYINTAVTVAHVAPKWSDPPTPGDMHDDRFPHTLYNAGCLVEAGVHHYRATGKTTLLAVATRMANYMCRIMGPPPRQNIVPGHAIPELAFVELHLLLHDNLALQAQLAASAGPVSDHAYLELAEFWIENRGNHAGRASMDVYDQDDRSVFEQPAMEGHAVRSALLATGIAIAADVTERADYYAIARRWWDNMIEAKMYVTGGLGAIPTFEGFGPDYELPNVGYAETCAAVAGGMFSANLGLATGDAKYFDILEREIYNGALAGVGLDGKSYFYTNYLESTPDRSRWSWNGCPCCPPMFLKLMGALPSWIYSTGSDGVYINLYIGSKSIVTLNGGQIHLAMTTEQPWDSESKLTLHLDKPSQFAVNLRIPDWCEESAVRVNGHAVNIARLRGYAHVERIWQSGDTVSITMPMPPRMVKANPKVAADTERVALMRGPIVYCLEGLDNPARVQSLVIPPSTKLRAEHKPNELGGMTQITGHGQLVRATVPPESDSPDRHVETAAFRAIPFYANTNRGVTDMAVWISDNPANAKPLTLAEEATPSASHCYENDTVWAMNNGPEPQSSDDGTRSRFTWWDHRGTTEWAQYSFPTKRRIAGVEVYWWDESRVHRDCRVPQSWQVLYHDDAEWRPVEKPTEYGTQMDRYNRTTFAPVATDALRISVAMQPGWSAGILQWRVLLAGEEVDS